MKKIILIYLIFLFCTPILKAQNKKKAFTQLVSGSLVVSGDFVGHYSFNGPLGSVIKASPSEGIPPCEISSLFRSVKQRAKQAIEAWLTLECTFEGQKSSYKTHRIFIYLDKADQKIQLPMLAKNLKNVQIQFQELSIKSGQK
jgi:hypothetical protein